MKVKENKPNYLRDQKEKSDNQNGPNGRRWILAAQITIREIGYC